MFYVVTMTHPDGPGWGQHVMAHVEYLNQLVVLGKLRASGPVEGLGQRAGLLIFTVADRAELDALIAADPFAVEGLIDDLTVVEWNPLFGAFAAEATPIVPPPA
ncbi:MAG: hypothetical protein RIQ99_311 [Pseudomonadota bacterium]